MDIEELKRRFGKRVQALRRQQHMTQEQLAEAIDRSTDTVSNIETGRLSTRIDTAMRLAQILGVSLSELFDIGETTPEKAPNNLPELQRLIDIFTPLDADVIDDLIEINQRILRMARDQPQ